MTIGDWRQREQDLAKSLSAIGAVKFGAFKLALHAKNPDAPLSPYYLNLRSSENRKSGPLSPDVIEDIAEILWIRSCEIKLVYQHVVGIPNAGDPLARAFHATGTKDRKGFGLLKLEKLSGSGDVREFGRIIEGRFQSRDRVLLIDDLITGADTKFAAIAALESQGLQVKDVLVIVDREQGGTIELLSRGYMVHSIFRISDLFRYYQSEGVLSEADYDRSMMYLRSQQQ